MRRFIPLLLLAVVACYAQSSFTDVPLVDCKGLLCVAMQTANGQTLTLALDLSARNSYLDSKSAQLADATLRSQTASGSAVQQMSLHGVRIGSAAFYEFPFEVFDLTPDPPAPGKKVKQERLPADGALAAGAFQNRLLVLDSAHRLLRFSSPQQTPPACPSPCGKLLWKHFQQFGALALTVDGFQVNDAPVDAQIDTLFKGTLLLYPAGVERLKLKRLSKSKDQEAFPYAQNGLLLARGEDVTESFHGIPLAAPGPIYFWADKSEAPGAVQFDATVGLALLAHGIATFDFRGMQFWMEGALP